MLNLDFATKIRPISGIEQIRLGSKFDGGYVVPTNAVKVSETLISFGYGNDSNFERHFIQLSKNKKSFIFDSRINLLYLTDLLISDLKYFFNSQRRRYLLYRFKTILMYIRLRSLKRVQYNNFKIGSNFDLLNKNIDLNGVFDLLKIYDNFILKSDIEGAEYEIFNLKNSHLKNANCLIIEFHNVDVRTSEFFMILDQFATSFVITNVHINNFTSVVDGIPQTLEMAFLNKKLLPTKFQFELVSSIPSVLDSPNNPRISEIKFVY